MANIPSAEVATIIESLRASAAQILSAVLHSTPLKSFNIGSLGNFPYYWQDPRNLQFNAKTYDWINRNLMANTTPVQLDQPFTDLFIKALGAISYKLSKADQASLIAGQSAATNQQAALLNAWKAAFGSLPATTAGQQPIDAILATICTWSSAGNTTLMAIQNSHNLNVLLDKTPASGKAVLPVLSDYLNAINSVISLQNATSLNTGYLAQALANVQTPTTNNGGLTTDDNVIHPAYAVSTSLSDIINGISAHKNDMTLTMSVSRSSSSEYRVTIQGGASFTIPILDLFTLSTSANASYFQDRIATSSNTISITMTFTGITLVNFGPTAYDEATGLNWYFLQPIRDAIKNGQQDVSGYVFSPDPGIDFSANGPFGLLTGVAISNYPSVTINVTAADYTSIQTEINQSASVGLSFLGIPLGIGGSESTYSADAHVDAASQTVTIQLNPPQELVAGQSVDSVGWILGVQTLFPAQ